MTARHPLFMAVGAVLALGWAATAAAVSDQNFPATGQTTCYASNGAEIDCAGTRQDGDVQAGATLRYKDLGNGTIIDLHTRLVWEKKSDDEAVNDNNNRTSHHDVDNIYTSDEAFAAHVFTLNNSCTKDETVDCLKNTDCVGVGDEKCGFTLKRDWRVPNVKELQSIVNYENFNPAVSSAFNTNCAGATILTGSCTAAAPYWSSTTDDNSPQDAWLVDFLDGFVDAPDKSFKFHVRAVRGGL